jgi:predicted ribonuclease YlaK
MTTRKAPKAAAPHCTKCEKTFILDTNVLLHNAESIEAFEDNHVVIPMAVIEELDHFKTHNDELGRNARHVIIDEAQNLTPHEVKTIITRAGENTKMVLTGDPYQIDNPYLDASSNGLTYATERLKTLNLHGHMTLKTSERSALAAVAAEYL